MAGLVFYYNTGHYHYANITANYDGSKQYLSVVTSDNYTMEFQEELVEVTAVKNLFDGDVKWRPASVFLRIRSRQQLPSARKTS